MAAGWPSIADPRQLSGIENELDKYLNICGTGYIISNTVKWYKD